MAALQFNIADVPFSRYGSYLALSRRDDGVYLRSVHGDAARSEICRIELLSASAADSRPLDYRVYATPQCLSLRSSAGDLDICFADARTLRLRAGGIGMRLLFRPGLYDRAVAHGDAWIINSFTNRLQLALSTLNGISSVDTAWRGDRAEHLRIDCRPAADRICEIALVEFQSTWPQFSITQGEDFDHCVAAVAGDFQRWLENAPDVGAEYRAARELAAYIQWSCVVAPAGLFKRPAMLMSKNWLNGVWSWDHCFNAMALHHRNPALAVDQLLLPFDYQDAAGALPDAVNDKLTQWNFCKPPLQGWALLWMLRRGGTIAERQLSELYSGLRRSTEWWLRRSVAGGLPQYFHGNDSGWDNCTLFDDGLPLASADLAALLSVQMEALAELAGRLRKPSAARRWQRRAQDLLRRLLDQYWRSDGFAVARGTVAESAALSINCADGRAINCADGRAINGADGRAVDAAHDRADSLLSMLPILLGARLPAPIRAKLIAELRGERFLTAHGLASENPASPYYQDDGYWRGPIWAPATLLIVDGLRDCGELELAREIGRRFCAMAARSGMAECFDARSGAALRDRAHTWTASVFLILAHEYV